MNRENGVIEACLLWQLPTKRDKVLTLIDGFTILALLVLFAAAFLLEAPSRRAP